MLRGELQKLALREWRHPSTGEPVRFGVSTIERWLYRARRERHDPVGVLKRKRRKDAGTQDSLSAAVRAPLRAQYAPHPRWAGQLHADNLRAPAQSHPELSPLPPYSTLRRLRQGQALLERRQL